MIVVVVVVVVMDVVGCSDAACGDVDSRVMVVMNQYIRFYY